MPNSLEMEKFAMYIYKTVKTKQIGKEKKRKEKKNNIIIIIKILLTLLEWVIYWTELSLNRPALSLQYVYVYLHIAKSPHLPPTPTSSKEKKKKKKKCLLQSSLMTKFQVWNSVTCVTRITVDSRYLEFQRSPLNTSRYPYLDISELREWGKQ